MLVRYKKALEKIAMGLLSYMPDGKDVKRLMETIQQYEEQDDWFLYLWKKDDEYVGVIGLQEQEGVATIQHITVIPSYRGEGVAMAMLQELQANYERIVSSAEMDSFIQKCLQKKETER